MFPQLFAAVRVSISRASMMLPMVYANHVDELIASPIGTNTMDDVIFGTVCFGLGKCREICLVRFTPVRDTKTIWRSFGW